MKNPVQRISLDRILTSLCPVFLLAAVKEFFVVNDKALMNSGTNYTACVISGDGEMCIRDRSVTDAHAGKRSEKGEDLPPAPAETEGKG